ncbi:MAG: prolipoprotein diacylglyceryl transferase [Candidatus Spyradocola sp.]
MLPFIHLGSLRIPMYGLCMVVGILVASSVATVRAKRRGGDENSLFIIAACTVGFALAGAKLLYIVASYGLGNALRSVLSGDFSCITESGLVYYGGLITGIPGAFLGARLARENPGKYCDAVAPVIPLGHAFGRLGCFFAGCCYGIPCSGPLCVSFPAVGVTHTVFPVQLLEMAINLGLFALLCAYTRSPRGFRSLYLYLALYSVCRFALEFLRGDLIRGVSGGLSTSQWISIGLFAVSSLLLLLPRLLDKRAHRQ